MLPSIQNMLNGVPFDDNNHQWQDTPSSFDHPEPIEPSAFATIPGGSRHMRTHSDITPLQLTNHQQHNQSRNHRRAVSEHSFEHIIPIHQGGPVDSGSQVPPYSYHSNQQRLHLPGQTANKYVCHYCHKGFSRPSSLRTHIYSHTGEKPYVCFVPNCNRSFSVQSNMRRHMKVHRQPMVDSRLIYSKPPFM